MQTEGHFGEEGGDLEGGGRSREYGGGEYEYEDRDPMSQYNPVLSALAESMNGVHRLARVLFRAERRILRLAP